MFCSKCGVQLQGEAQFCGNCGAPAAQPAREGRSAPPGQGGPWHPASAQTAQAAAQPVAVLERERPAPAQDARQRESLGAGGGFFDLGEYVIDEKVSAFKFTNAYKVFDSSGAQIGAVEQQKVSGGAKAARLLLGSSMKALQAFKLDIKDLNGAILAGVERRGMSSGLRGIREINIYDGTGRSIGAIKTLFSMLKPKMEIMSPAGEAIGRIQGDWKGWNFTIADASGAEIGTVSKKWNGAMKELFTTADKYRVSLSPRAVGVYRVAIVAAAITIDMVLKETS